MIHIMLEMLPELMKLYIRCYIYGTYIRHTGNRAGEPPIWLAAREGRISEVSSLLMQGADVNVYSQCDHTAFGVACRQGHLQVR